MTTPSAEAMDDVRRRRHSRIVGVALVTTILGVAVVEIALGALPTRSAAHDLFIFLDGAWRVGWGQTPHVDFFSGFGVMVWKPLQLAFSATDFGADGIGLARAMYTVVLATWALLLARRQLPPLQTAIIVLFTLLVAASPHELGIRFNYFSNSMFYNRVGYALLFMIVIETLYLSSPWRPGSRSDRFWGGISTGAAIACLALLKVSFVAPGIALAIAGIVLCGTTRRHLLGIATGGTLVLSFSVICMDLNPAAWVSEMVFLSKSRTDSLVGAMLRVAASDTLVLGLGLAATVCLAILTMKRRADAAKYLAASITVLASDVYCRATNTQGSALPLVAFWATLSIFVVASGAVVSKTQRVISIAIITMLAILSVPFLGRDALSLAASIYVSTTMDTSQTLRFDAPRLASWTTEKSRDEDPRFDYANGPELVSITNDGLHLLQANSASDETIGSLSFTDRFSVALDRPPALGGAPWIHLGNNFSLSDPPPAEMLLGRPDVLMVQRFESIDGSLSLRDAYPDLLSTEYELVASSSYWELYRRVS